MLSLSFYSSLGFSFQAKNALRYISPRNEKYYKILTSDETLIKFELSVLKLTFFMLVCVALDLRVFTLFHCFVLTCFIGISLKQCTQFRHCLASYIVLSSLISFLIPVF